MQCSVGLPKNCADLELSIRNRLRQIGVTFLETPRTYDSFFLRSAQRLFIANDKRLLPSGVRPLPRLSPVVAGEWGAATIVLLTGRDKFVPSSSAIARLSRFPSCFKSAIILSKSTIHSSLVLQY
jgi:hypothetical protein